jgi:hypothetical protein
MSASKQIIRDVGNSGNYEIVVTERHSHWLGFNVYQVLGRTESGARMYNRDGYSSSPDPVEDRTVAQVFISGSIKWDGCSDMSIDDEPLHFCGRDNVEEFAALLSAIYDLAAELIQSYEGGLTPAETAIRDAMLAVEDAGADPLLTEAINLLQQARDKVADYVDRDILKPTPQRRNL